MSRLRVLTARLAGLVGRRRRDAECLRKSSRIWSCSRSIGGTASPRRMPSRRPARFPRAEIKSKSRCGSSAGSVGWTCSDRTCGTQSALCARARVHTCRRRRWRWHRRRHGNLQRRQRRAAAPIAVSASEDFERSARPSPMDASPAARRTARNDAAEGSVSADHEPRDGRKGRLHAPEAEGTPVSHRPVRRRRRIFSAVRSPLAMVADLRRIFPEELPDGAVLSYRLWRGAFSGDPHIVGKTLTLTLGNVPILGVAAPDMDVPRGTDAWLNLQLDPQARVTGSTGIAGASVNMEGVLSQRLAAVAAVLGRDFPGGRRRPRVRRCAFRRDDGWRSAADADHRVVGDGAAASARVCQRGESAAGACVAALRRDRDPRAVGASRGRIAAQLLTESLVCPGALAGVALAYVAVLCC